MVAQTLYYHPFVGIQYISIICAHNPIAPGALFQPADCVTLGTVDTNALNSLADGPALPFSISIATLMAGLFWSAIGAGFCIYGKKQRSAPAWIGGLALIGICYFIGSALWMSVAAVGIIAGIWLWFRYGNFD
jgi:hypothetical protein